MQIVPVNINFKSIQNSQSQTNTNWIRNALIFESGLVAVDLAFIARDYSKTKNYITVLKQEIEKSPNEEFLKNSLEYANAKLKKLKLRPIVSILSGIGMAFLTAWVLKSLLKNHRESQNANA